MAVPASPDAQMSRRRRNRLLAVVLAVLVIVLIVVAALASSSSSSSSGVVKLSAITIRWDGSTYTLLDNPYASKPGDKGFNFDAEFIDSGTCYSNSACFDPGTSSFSISSLTSGFQVVWVTACYSSLGYSALVGPIYGPYSSKPPVIPSGCLSGGTDVDMSGVTAGSSVSLTVDLQFTSSAAYTGTLSLSASPVTTSITTTGAGDTTALNLDCSPGVVAMGALTPCTATVNDTATAPKATGAPTGYVNFTAPSGTFGPGPSCQLQPSDSGTNSSSACTVNYLTATLGSVLVFASYGGDSGHAGSSAGFGVETFEYTLSVTPTSQSVAQGSGAAFTVTATIESESASQGLPNATLAVQICNTGTMTCTFSQADIVPGGSPVILTITPITGTVQVPYTYSFAVIGMTGSGDYVFTVTSNTVSLDVT